MKKNLTLFLAAMILAWGAFSPAPTLAAPPNACPDGGCGGPGVDHTGFGVFGGDTTFSAFGYINGIDVPNCAASAATAGNGYWLCTPGFSSACTTATVEIRDWNNNLVTLACPGYVTGSFNYSTCITKVSLPVGKTPTGVSGTGNRLCYPFPLGAPTFTAQLPVAQVPCSRAMQAGWYSYQITCDQTNEVFVAFAYWSPSAETCAEIPLSGTTYPFFFCQDD